MIGVNNKPTRWPISVGKTNEKKNENRGKSVFAQDSNFPEDIILLLSRTKYFVVQN